MKLSVIIPTCNEADQINTTIHALESRAAEKPFEIIVVDCDSEDGTADCILSKNVVVIRNPVLAGKKWMSLRMGADLSQGDVLFFLDADTLVPQDYDLAIAGALTKKSVVGGAFEFSFDKKNFPLFIVSVVNRIRYRFRNRFYGDQGIFVTKDAYMKAGGWPKRSLMEAAYFCKILQKTGKLKLLNKSVVTSSRRFTEGGVWKVFFYDCKIWLMDLLGIDVQKYGHAYWQKNAERARQPKKQPEEWFNPASGLAH